MDKLLYSACLISIHRAYICLHHFIDSNNPLQQLLQTLKDGTMEMAELPLPVPAKGEVLVRTHFSAISTGTEGKTVSDARKGYLAKARARKEEVGKVVKMARIYGLVDTYKMVMTRLESLQPLGYSLSGVVVAVGEGVRSLKPGDHVACGGASAAHAEAVCVPENLCVALSPDTPLDEAAFTTIAAIAMQGIRRAGCTLGENCVVIGLGLLGQITIRLLRAAGVRTFGVDLKANLIDLALQSGAEDACLRNSELIEARIAAFTHGHGADSIIITAATQSSDPVEFAGVIARQRAKVVIVGNVPTGFSRKHYYRKELDLLMSTSYGPGRYDTAYEDHGLDYPIGHVRWTENRNMQAFAALLQSGAVRIADLISHRFPFEQARNAFDLVVNPELPKMGIVLAYNTSRPLRPASSPTLSQGVPTEAVSFIGAGSFAAGFLLPEMKKHMAMSAVATGSPHTAENAKRQFGFSRAHTDVAHMLDHDPAGAVVIATRHDTHAPLALQALRAGKRVCVEKPLCIHLHEYSLLVQQLSQPGSPDLMVGFNRRFAPAVTRVKQHFPSGPVAIHYRINAGKMPADHWIHHPETGGGRLLGEACHFIDLCAFMAGSRISSVSATAMAQAPQLLDTFAATLHFENGSIATISYFSNGSNLLPKEHIEICGGSTTAVIHDFKELHIAGAKSHRYKTKQDKGHAAEMQLLAHALKTGAPMPVSAADSLHATLATFAVQASVQAAGERIDISAFESACHSATAN